MGAAATGTKKTFKNNARKPEHCSIGLVIHLTP
ncbi:MAG: hypothetical protein ACI92C_000996 [Neolewinella sp.]|jgi:hypothetical protein